MSLAKKILREATLSTVYQTVTFNAPGIYYPPYGRSAFLLQGQGQPGNYASGGNYANTNPGTPGNYAYTNPGSGGNYAGTNPGSGGNYTGTNPGTPGNYAGTNPGSGGNYAGTNPGTPGNYAGSNPYTPGNVLMGTLYQYYTPYLVDAYNTYPGSDFGNYSYSTVDVPGYVHTLIYATYYNPGTPGNAYYNPYTPGNDYYNPYYPGNPYYNPYTPGNDYYNPYYPGNAYYNSYIPGNPNYNPYVPGNPNYNPYYPGNPSNPNTVLGVTLPGGAADSSAPVIGYVPVTVTFTNAGTPISVPTGGYVKIQNNIL